MPKEDLSQEDAPSLVKRYVAAALAYGAAREDADSKATNREARLMGSVYDVLKGRGTGPDGLGALLTLLVHEDPEVRSLAAADTLEIAPDKAVAVLEEVECLSGLVGFSAEMALKRWKKGEFRSS